MTRGDVGPLHNPAGPQYVPGFVPPPVSRAARVGRDAAGHPIREAFRSLRTFTREIGSVLTARLDFVKKLGLTYDGLRDVYDTLGYAQVLGISDYRERYQRGGIAERIVEAYPNATWAGGARIVENTDPNDETDFERDVRVLFERLDVWSRLTRADILASLGHYSILLIGAEGNPASELPNPLSSINYLKPIAEDGARVNKYEKDRNNPRFGMPLTYSISVRTAESGPAEWIDVHWTRVLHVAEGLLEDDLYGKPRLRAIWNYLDDLDKLVGGGSEAAWKRMDPGMQVDIDPEIELNNTEEGRVSDELDEYQHGLRRIIRTRGTKINLLASQVQSFGPNATAVVELVSGTTGIPQRILLGSERGELASSQDRFNWSDRINERRRGFATPLVRMFLSRLIDNGVIAKPAGYVSSAGGSTAASGTPATPATPAANKNTFPGGYDIVWPEVGEVSNITKAELTNKLAAAAQAMSVAGQPPVLTTDEIRNLVFGLGPHPKALTAAAAVTVDLSAKNNGADGGNTNNNASTDGSGDSNNVVPATTNRPSGSNIPNAPVNGASAGR